MTGLMLATLLTTATTSHPPLTDSSGSCRWLVYVPHIVRILSKQMRQGAAAASASVVRDLDPDTTGNDDRDGSSVGQLISRCRTGSSARL